MTVGITKSLAIPARLHLLLGAEEPALVNVCLGHPFLDTGSLGGGRTSSAPLLEFAAPSGIRRRRNHIIVFWNEKQKLIPNDCWTEFPIKTQGRIQSKPQFTVKSTMLKSRQKRPIKACVGWHFEMSGKAFSYDHILTTFLGLVDDMEFRLQIFSAFNR